MGKKEPIVKINEPAKINVIENIIEKKNQAGSYECPDSKCIYQCKSVTDFFQHMSDIHCLKCKMPFCTFSCFSFSEYSDHFENVHCLIQLPQKRRLFTTIDDPTVQKPFNPIN
jgi:hypothetical protein